jgi:hypothetical protein
LLFRCVKNIITVFENFIETFFEPWTLPFLNIRSPTVRDLIDS